MTAQEWLKTLRAYVNQNPIESQDREFAGPVWWYAIHAIAMRDEIPEMTPGQFLAYWLSQFPCKVCVKHFKDFTCTESPPKDWALARNYFYRAHDLSLIHI